MPVLEVLSEGAVRSIFSYSLEAEKMSAQLEKGVGLGAAVAVFLGLAVTTDGLAAQANVSSRGTVTTVTVPAVAAQAASSADFVNVRAMPLPSPGLAAPGLFDGDIAPQGAAVPGFSRGSLGNGQTAPVKLPPAASLIEADDAQDMAADGFERQEYGMASHPYTTMRVDLVGNNESKAAPYRAAGQLLFKDGSVSYMCSASLIKRGVIVTAAHCVAAYGQKRFYSNWQFIPARYDSTAPYGTWAAASATILTSYYNGTDSCYAPGVVCQNDVAVIRLVPQSKAFPGTKTGWFGYGWDGYGFTPDNLALINQLGYPASHDSGKRMQRTDSHGFVSATYSNNTVWGGRQTGGSSGGPEVVNLGILPTLSSEAPIGYEGSANIVVGVTSWGYTNNMVKQQGASPFTSTNIVPLVAAACAGQTTACN